MQFENANIIDLRQYLADKLTLITLLDEPTEYEIDTLFETITKQSDVSFQWCLGVKGANKHSERLLSQIKGLPYVKLVDIAGLETGAAYDKMLDEAPGFVHIVHQFNWLERFFVEMFRSVIAETPEEVRNKVIYVGPVIFTRKVEGDSHYINEILFAEPMGIAEFAKVNGRLPLEAIIYSNHPSIRFGDGKEADFLKKILEIHEGYANIPLVMAYSEITDGRESKNDEKGT